MKIKKIKFDIKEELPFKRNTRKNQTHNSELFVQWLINVIKNHYQKELKKNEQYSALCLSMNKANNRYIADHVDPFVFLDYSPKNDESLADDEYEIDLDDLVKVRID